MPKTLQAARGARNIFRQYKGINCKCGSRRGTSIRSRSACRTSLNGCSRQAGCAVPAGTEAREHQVSQSRNSKRLAIRPRSWARRLITAWPFSARQPARNVVSGISGFDDAQRRVIAPIVGVRLVCAYVPNGQSLDSDKYQYKLMARGFRALAGAGTGDSRPSGRAGDYNIAPEDRDVHDPKAWEGQVLVSEPERAAFRRLVALGLADSFRLFEQPERAYLVGLPDDGFKRIWPAHRPFSPPPGRAKNTPAARSPRRPPPPPAAGPPWG